MIPGVGEYMDLADFFNSELTSKQRNDAAKSFACNLFVAGVAPNQGGIRRAWRSAGDLAPRKVPTPKLKGVGKIADAAVPKCVPSNWRKADIEDAILDYERSISIRKAEAADFDATRGGGHTWTRKSHNERIVEEENFLRQLRQKLDDMQ